ncbi:hypothetical protein F5050DRAFT_1541403, partial [Lentinula boryana]
SRVEALERQRISSANAVRSPEKKCQNCQRNGHLAEECFRKGGGKEGQYPSWWKGRRENQGSSNTLTNSVANATMIPEVGELAQHYGLSTTAIGPDSGDIYADTGASDHFFKNRADFITY